MQKSRERWKTTLTEPYPAPPPPPLDTTRLPGWQVLLWHQTVLPAAVSLPHEWKTLYSAPLIHPAADDGDAVGHGAGLHRVVPLTHRQQAQRASLHCKRQRSRRHNGHNGYVPWLSRGQMVAAAQLCTGPEAKEALEAVPCCSCAGPSFHILLANRAPARRHWRPPLHASLTHGTARTAVECLFPSEANSEEAVDAAGDGGGGRGL